MNVEVRLYAGLHTESVRSSGDVFSVPLAEGATLSDLFSHLGIQPDLVHLAIVNGRIPTIAPRAWPTATASPYFPR